VTIGGYADDATAVSYLSACDCVVIPSRMESIPVILSDALQMGKPLIVSDVGDMGELLRRIPAGIVVSPNDSKALCRAMFEMDKQDRSTCSPTSKNCAQFEAQVVQEWLRRIHTE
jgi:glycosyltransferase involved in cell wall biosynthesis